VYNHTLYAIAKSQEDPIGHMVLLRSETPQGQYTFIKRIANGARHVGLHLKGNILYVFFTLIGDDPERILLGTMDLRHDDWNLLPGPIILVPAEVGIWGASKMGPAACKPVQELRDPFFVPDGDEGESELKGTLFYTLYGEQTIGASKIKVNLNQYHNSVAFRSPDRIDTLVFESSSLADQEGAQERPLLITGVGRSGTTFTCKYLNQFGWSISHDNSKDCGPFGGSFGASSWLHAFRQTFSSEEVFPLRVKKVVHLIRNPLAVVKSRLARAKQFFGSDRFMLYHMGKWENKDGISNHSILSIATNNTILASFALRNWINRNSFVSQHAEWRVSIEDLSKDPLQTWMLCLVAGRDDCPNLVTIRAALQAMDKSINNNGKVKGHEQDDLIWWKCLAAVNEDDVRIALKMANEYGYLIDKRLKERYQTSSIQYACGFGNDLATRLGPEEPRNWGCSIIKNSLQ